MSIVPLATRQATARATNPHGSAWVAANAGSGKTFVLTQRVLRLLLDGQDPSSLLCLTFTKAAASEMATRVFDQLAEWTQLSDQDLAEKLNDIQGRATTRDVARARTLFAKALETPGGLKIQTIHAFCESLLHQFPLEADVPASFTVLDDREADALMTNARAQVLAKAASGEDPHLQTAFQGMASRFADTTIADHLDAMMRARHAMVREFDRAGRQTTSSRLAYLIAEHSSMLGLGDVGEDEARTILRDPMGSSPFLSQDRVEAYRSVAQSEGTATDVKRIEPLWTAHTAETADERRDAYWNGLFNKAGRGSPKATGPKSLFRVKDAFPEALANIQAEQERALNLQTHVGFIDLMRLSLAVLERFGRLKTQSGALDFGDLIAKTARLLTRAEAQAWVRYKMDQRINHILVDEAQDTSADQWSIIKALSDDFFAGEGAHDPSSSPTFFAVGDEKQSIYSFQGADPRHFDGTRRGLETRAAQAGLSFASPVPLILSFRSTPDVLSAVDTVFSRPEALQGVSTDTGLTHNAIRNDAGLVEIWPVIRSAKAEEPEDWTAPVDALPAAHITLAQAIARRVRNLVDSGGQAGDILILLRRRGAMADAISKHLKRLSVPVAGTDRLVLTEHIAVEDLMALMQVVLLPEDDLSLACLLTSPLVGLSDEQLEQLCVERPGLLIDALNAETNDATIRSAALDIQRWRGLADYASPFTFLSTVLGRDGGLKKLIGRLGEDARDPVDELLRLARTEETRQGSGLANLEAFLDTLRRLKLDVKRDMDARTDKVRIMTVHGSKGLEAKTVFLVDTCSLPKAPSGVIELPEEEHSTNTGTPPLILLAGDTGAPAYQKAKQQGHERQLEEYRRLLYVAMTRARDQLIVTGHKKGEGDIPQGCWYDLIDQALAPDARDVGSLEGAEEAGPVRVWRKSPWPEGDPLGAEAAESTAADPRPDPSFLALLRTETPAPTQPAPLRPSQARSDIKLNAETWPPKADADAHIHTVSSLSDADTSAALTFGTLVHGLLEPRDQPTLEQAKRVARSIDNTVAPDLIERAVEHANTVRQLPEASVLFGSGSRAEVPLRGTFLDGAQTARPVTGSIDRLVVHGNEVWAIDFKTNAVPPADGRLLVDASDYVSQLAIYSDVLSQIWPDKQVRCGLVWTALPRLDWLSGGMIAQALADLRKA